MARAIRPASARIPAAILRRCAARWMGGNFAQAFWACRAASTARSTASAGLSGISEMTVSRAGLSTGMRLPTGPSSRVPAMKFLCSGVAMIRTSLGQLGLEKACTSSLMTASPMR
jgi:hypothetical protein